MRILQLIVGLGAGGAERQLLELCRALRDEGHAVEAASLKRAGGATGLRLAAEGFAVHDLRGQNLLDPRPLLRLRRLLRSARFDVLHTHLARADLIGGLARRGLPLAHISTRHSDFEPWSGRRPLWRAYCRELRRIDRLSAVSGAVARALREWGADPARIVVLPGLAGSPALAALPPPHVPPRTIGFLGRLDRVKGIDLFLDVATLLAARRPGLEFVVAGDGPEAAWARRRSARRGLPLRFLGWVDDPVELLSRVDLLLVPSRREGLGLAALEAGCAGRPVVGSAVGGLAELLGPRAVAPRAAALARAVEEALELPAATDRPAPGDPRRWAVRYIELYTGVHDRTCSGS